MDYVRLGTTELKVSRLCLGTMTYGTPAWRPWVLDEPASRPFLKRALEHGINFFDTANMYSRGVSEEVVGHVPPPGPDPKMMMGIDDWQLRLKDGLVVSIEPILANGVNGRGRLSTGGDWPGAQRATEESDEVAPIHRMIYGNLSQPNER